MPNDCCSSCCIDGAECEVVRTIQQHSLTRQILASSLASVISIVSLNPVTVVKVRLQRISSDTTLPTGGAVAIPKLTPIGDVVRNVLKTHGIAGFWSGVRTGIVMSVPNTVLYMSVYEHLKEDLAAEPRLQSIQAITPAFAGALARMVSVTIISPLELVRTIQTGGASQSMGTIWRSVVQKDGFMGLYKGWAPSVLRDCPFSAIYWLGFETLRPVYSSLLLPSPRLPTLSATAGVLKGNSGQRKGFPAYITFLSGATASMVAAVCTHPFDVLKTRQQVGAWNSVSSPVSSAAAGAAGATGAAVGGADGVTYGTVGAAAMRPSITLAGVYRSEGILALYRGLSMRLATVIPASAIMVTIYETIKRLDIDV